MATSRKKLSELPPDQFGLHQTSKGQAKEPKGARSPASRPPQNGSRLRKYPCHHRWHDHRGSRCLLNRMEVEVLQGRGMSWLVSISFHNHSLSFAKGEGSPLMQATVTPHQRQAAKREIESSMKQGASTHEALVCSTVPRHRTRSLPTARVACNAKKKAARPPGGMGIQSSCEARCSLV